VKSNRTHAASRSTGIAALLLAGAWCLPALASNGLTNTSEEASDSVPTAAVEAASPILIEKIDTALHEIDDGDDAKKPIETSELQSVTPHLPGVSNASLPRFRREMFRTDI